MNRSLLESVLRRVAPMAADGVIADADLLRRFTIDADEAAFAVLVGRHGPLVWAVCRQLLSHESDAEDAFQATFLALVQSAASIRNPAGLGAWLHGVAYRVATKAKRTAARRHHREQVAATVEAADPISQATWEQLQQAVHEEVHQLPELLRIAFVVCEWEGTGQQEAAKALGWKLGTLSGRLTKARQRLLDRLAKRGIPATAVVVGALAGGTAAIVPSRVTAHTLGLAQCGFDFGSGISQTVLELARGATEVSMTRLKLLTAAAVVVGILAAGTATKLIPHAEAQRPPGADPLAPAAAPGGMGGAGGSAMSRGPSAQWEYHFVPRKGDSLEQFERILNHEAASGWEYCGTESLKVSDERKDQWGTSPTMVFKRRVNSPQPPMMGGMSGFGGMPGMPGAGGMPGAAGGMGMPGISAPSSGVRPGAPGAAPTSPSSPPTSPFGASGPPMSGSGKPTEKITMIKLEHTRATDLATILKQLFTDQNCRIAFDPNTNTLLVQANDETLKTLRILIDRLEVLYREQGK